MTIFRRALVLGQLSAALCITAIASGLPFAGTALAVLGWGMSGALFINSGRTLFQENASEANRARVLSVYALGVMGGGPIGSVVSGLLATHVIRWATSFREAAPDVTRP